MKTPTTAWQRLVTAARHAPGTEDAGIAPFGFSTRVAALAMAIEPPTMRAMMNRLSWRALGVALMLMIFSIAANYSSLSQTSDNEQDPFDPVAEELTSS
jgi:hypothetical protein